MRHIPGETHCAACSEKLVANRFGFNDHKCKGDAENVSCGDESDSRLSDKQKRRRNRRRERDCYSQRLGDGFLIQGMGGD